MTVDRGSFVLAAAVLAFSAQAPAAQPQPASLPGTPLRHLEYAYSVDYQTTGSVDTGAIGPGAGAGRASYFGGSGRQGTLMVDVMASAKDGGLVIRVAEWVQAQPRASQSFICAAYPNTSVICPPDLPVTDAETSILQYLGRNFVDESSMQNNHWQATYKNQLLSVVADFTVDSVDPSGKVATIVGTSKQTSLSGANASWDDAVKIVYDLGMEVPDSIHESADQSVRGAVGYKATYDFHLTKDSLAKTP